MGQDGQFEAIRVLGEGCHFGEIALINNSRRTMTVMARTESQLLSLSREAFDRILGDIKALLKLDYQLEE